MNNVIFVLCVFVLTLSFFVLWKAQASVRKLKEIMYLVYDWLEELESDRSKCCCHDEPEAETE